MSIDVQPYIDLIRRFLNEEITTEAFEKQFLHMFKAEKSLLPDQVYEPMNWIFTSIDTHVADNTGYEREPYEINDREFFQKVSSTYSKLLTLS